MPYKDPEKRKIYQAEYNKRWLADPRNKEKIFSYSKKYNDKRYGTEKRKEQLRDVRFRRHHRNKLKVLSLYGYSCVYCGINKYEVLTVDHILNNGAEHRKTDEYKKLNNGGMWGVLSSTEYRPDLYQILCVNCNLAKYRYGIEPGKNTYESIKYWENISEKRYGGKHEDNLRNRNSRLFRPSLLRGNPKDD